MDKQSINEIITGIGVTLGFIFFGSCLIIALFFVADSLFNKDLNNTVLIQKEPSGKLYELLKKEIVHNSSWICSDYVAYYNQTLKKYNEGLIPPERNLDIREIRMFDVCNGLTLCDSYHAVLFIGGYGQECIFDQQEIKCIDFNIA